MIQRITMIKLSRANKWTTAALCGRLLRISDKWGLRFDSETTGFIYLTSEAMDSGGGEAQ